MAIFGFPNSARLQTIAQELMPHLMRDDPLFDFFPIETQEEDTLIWEQKDNYVGLQHVRGLNNKPPRVRPIGVRRFTMEPSAYGEFELIDELQLTRRRKIGEFGEAIDLSDLVLEKQDQLLQRHVDRLRWLAWTLLSTGTFSVQAENGALVATDSYNMQSYTAPVTWATSATAAPLADFSNVQLLSRGYSVDFGARAMAFMNRQTFNDLRTNTNAQDIYGRRTAGLGTFNNQAGLNQLLQGDDLPLIVIYDRNYRDDNGIVQLFIPYKTVIVVGVRPAGQPVGAFRMTRNVNNPDFAPGAYTRVIDKGEIELPREIQVHHGWNGGPLIFYPSAVVKMSV